MTFAAPLPVRPAAPKQPQQPAPSNASSAATFAVPALPQVAAQAQAQAQALAQAPSQANAAPVNANAPPAAPPLNYSEPAWGGRAVPSQLSFMLEVIKGGSIVETIPLRDKSFFTVGRLPICDIAMEHPSISRYHAVLQYRTDAPAESAAEAEDGPNDAAEIGKFYLYDMASTHGTLVNKTPIKPKVFVRVQVGHLMQFGDSTRMLVLCGPVSEDELHAEETSQQKRRPAAAATTTTAQPHVSAFAGAAALAKQRAARGDGGDDERMDLDFREMEQESRQRALDARQAGSSGKATDDNDEENEQGVSWGLADDDDHDGMSSASSAPRQFEGQADADDDADSDRSGSARHVNAASMYGDEEDARDSNRRARLEQADHRNANNLSSFSKQMGNRPSTQGSSRENLSDADVISKYKQSGEIVFGGDDDDDSNGDGLGGKQRYYFKDPKKALRAFFDREGLHMNFDVEERGPGHDRNYTARIKVPSYTAASGWIQIEETAGRKREAERAAALEACKQLDQLDLLQPGHAASNSNKGGAGSADAGADLDSGHRSFRNRPRRLVDSDGEEIYSDDDDDDTMYDASGEMERKRQLRRQRQQQQQQQQQATESGLATPATSSQANSSSSIVYTYDTLLVRREELAQEIAAIEARLAEDAAHSKQIQAGGSSGDSLDAYMDAVSATLPKEEKLKLRKQLQDLSVETRKVEKMIQIAKPTTFTTAAQVPARTAGAHEATAATSAPLAVKVRGAFAIPAAPKVSSAPPPPTTTTSEPPSLNVAVAAVDAAAPAIVPGKRLLETDSVAQEASSEAHAPPRKLARLDVQDDAFERADDIPQPPKYGAMLPPKAAPKAAASKPKPKAAPAPSFQDEGEIDEWVPPSGQSGDGRTSLNDRLGY
ncbi:solute carrier family 4 [Capsaspora owczarzaki ATCC 30864]|uniref:Solute carrier family 4 n=1 Tax=Capsaspora owczarzaki (strain ATCC 30864) TaxID=595528 RepID=A0A0D2WKB2_CAPO3|nr:solute carrier family 4 [Capsaspora owczarzaki ATCC 30864]KJE90003.1 solute carrier family 4 [Capsaspora owczarzaki ATCC 30864]|eukprot:XP_004349908.1 solute carrier family 4 [Capsaspora owczarzaki ATCC 30864]